MSAKKSSMTPKAKKSKATKETKPEDGKPVEPKAEEANAKGDARFQKTERGKFAGGKASWRPLATRSPTRPRRRGLSSLVGIWFNSAPRTRRGPT